MDTAELTRGVLVVCKPAGVTSRDVVNLVEQCVAPLKAGHAGTLDPMATGVLVIAFGAATRLIPYLQSGWKTYRAAFRLGLVSETDDITGTVEPVVPEVAVTAEQLADALRTFVGRQQQTPPQFSAVHVDGQRAYARARRGERMELPPREIEISSLELLSYDHPDLTVSMTCSTGTYVRSVGRDLGEKLGCGAVMTALERTAAGRFGLADGVPLEGLTTAIVRDRSLSPAAALSDRTAFRLTPAEIAATRQGRPYRSPSASELPDQAEAVLLSRATGELVAVAIRDAGRDCLQPRVVLPGAT